MPVTIRCPNADCAKRYQVPEEGLGSRATCKKCGTTFTVEMQADETAQPKGRDSRVAPGPVDASAGEAPELSLQPSPQPSPAAGGELIKIGPYSVVRRLGAGAMGEVWLAYDPSLQRHVAVKMLRPENAQSTHHFDRFVREARLAARLHHTNAVTVYQVGVEGQAAYIAMEYVEGQSLDVAVEPGRPMPWREATRAVRDAAAGLAAAHELGLIHRDVKPANLMRTGTGLTKVVDFGLARAQAGQTQLTREGAMLGTPAYMSPEAWQRQEVDARSDLYSLGCTYYYLLTGRPPFDADNFMALGYQHTHEPLPDPREHAAKLPDGVCRILAKAAAKDPAGRYRTAAEMQAELAALLAAPDESLTSGAPWEALQAAPADTGERTMLTGVWSAVARSYSGAKSAVGRSVAAPAGAMGRGRVRYGALTAAGFMALLIFGLVLSIRTRHGTVRIELSDPAADVEVKVDGDVIDVVGLEEPLRLTAGEHHLLVTSGDYQSVSKSFTVRRGEEQVLHVTLEPLEPPGPDPSVAEVRPPPAEPEPPMDPSEPPLAVAPFDEKQAKEHQAAWANHLGVPVEKTNSIGMQFVLIPPGEFMMGSPKSDYDNEKPQHRVRISKPFYVGKYPVTQEQWEAVVSSNLSGFKGQQNPVETVNWNECQEFLRKLNERTRESGREFRLPTEAEWEYACRAGTTTRYSFGDDSRQLGEYAWFRDNSDRRTHPVGEKKPNPWGLYDMHGNVLEWCADWYDRGYYAKSPVQDPLGPASGVTRVLRGGGWHRAPVECGSAHRHNVVPSVRTHFWGFRVALVLAEMKSAAERPAPARPEPLRLQAIRDHRVEAGGNVSLTVLPEDAEHWNGRLRFSLGPGAPAGAAIDGQTGEFAWTPGDDHEPGAYDVSILVEGPEDQQAQTRFTIVVTGASRAAIDVKQVGEKEIAIDLGGGVNLEMVLIPVGEFMMGSPDSDPDAEDREKPQHRVRITRPFYLGKYPVTQQQWQAVMGNNPSAFAADGRESDRVLGLDTRGFPVDSVSWHDTQEFLVKLNERPADPLREFRLPTEAEWEYACRAGTTTLYSFGDDASCLRQYAWYGENSGGRTHRVGQKKPNAWGLYDIHGNVLEWCQDKFAPDYYTKSPAANPTGPAWGVGRVLRGGSWGNDNLAFFRCAWRRHYADPRAHCSHAGFRVAQTVTP